MKTYAHALLSTTVLLGAVTSAFAAQPDEAKQLTGYIQTYCASCHSGDKSESRKYGDFLRVGILTSSSFIDRANPKASLLYKKVENGDMPDLLADNVDDFTDAERAKMLTIIENWIKKGAPELEEVKQATGTVNTKKAVELMLGDLRKQNNPEDVRYIVLNNLAANPKFSASLPVFQQGLTKLLNSLSWNKKLVLPTALDASGLVVRVRLSDFDWSQETWRELENRYSYKGEFLSEFDNFGEIRKLTKTSVPAIRADWFMEHASQPPLYFSFAQIPTSSRELERTLNVDVVDNIRKGKALRAGFNISGVSNNNRMIERHDIKDGAYWLSYDFGSNLGDKNLMKRPLGPTNANIADGSDLAFNADGGEIIFNLPNGLQAYMLVDSNGTRIDKGPAAIVSDTSRPDRLVVTGLSCMGCHSQGMILKNDEVLKTVQSQFNQGARGDMTKQNLDTLKALYGQKQFDSKIQEDVDRFVGALGKIGVTIASPEVIAESARAYEQIVDQKTVLLEFGISDAELAKLKKEKSDSPGGRVFEIITQSEAGLKRDVFEAIYRGRAEDLNRFRRGEADDNRNRN
jgi:hypothetical protein